MIESRHYRFYRAEVDRAIRDCGMWNDTVRAIVYTTVITETCDGRPKGWLNYTNPREPQFARFEPNDGDPPNKSWSTQRSGGLFQQQPQFWGPNVMDPYLSTRAFLLGVGAPFYAPGLRSFDYRAMEPWRAAQRVQGSEFADASNYRRNYPYALQLINETPAPANWWQAWFQREGMTMADYKTPDEFFDAKIKPALADLSGTIAVSNEAAPDHPGFDRTLAQVLFWTDYRTKIIEAKVDYVVSVVQAIATQQGGNAASEAGKLDAILAKLAEDAPTT